MDGANCLFCSLTTTVSGLFAHAGINDTDWVLLKVVMTKAREKDGVMKYYVNRRVSPSTSTFP